MVNIVWENRASWIDLMASTSPEVEWTVCPVHHIASVRLSFWHFWSYIPTVCRSSFQSWSSTDLLPGKMRQATLPPALFSPNPSVSSLLLYLYYYYYYFLLFFFFILWTVSLLQSSNYLSETYTRRVSKSTRLVGMSIKFLQKIKVSRQSSSVSHFTLSSF